MNRSKYSLTKRTDSAVPLTYYDLMPLEPPPIRVYDTLNKAEKAIKQWARDEHYGIVTKQITYDKQKPPGLRKREHTYDKYGDSRQKPFFIRNTSTRKDGCRFKFAVTQKRLSDNLWHVEIIYPHHNHKPTLSTSQHPCHRERTPWEKAIITRMMNAHCALKQIYLTLIQQNPNTSVTLQDIYNERKDLRKRDLGDLSPIEKLIELLHVKKEDYAYAVHSSKVALLSRQLIGKSG